MQDNHNLLNPDFEKRARVTNLSLQYHRALRRQEIEASIKLREERKARQSRVYFNPRKGRPTDLIDGMMRTDIVLGMAEIMLERTSRGHSTNEKVLAAIYSEEQIAQCVASAVEAALFSRLSLRLRARSRTAIWLVAKLLCCHGGGIT